jgi:hypothetical protein
LMVMISGLRLAAEEPPTPSTGGFSALRLHVDEVVYVTDLTTGVEVKGAIRSLSPHVLAIDGYQFEFRQRLKIERPGDPLWDGAAIGFGVGALFGVTIGSEACLHASPWKCVVSGGASYAALGALIDWAHEGRRSVYATSSERAAVRIAPEVSARQKSVTFAWSFK